MNSISSNNDVKSIIGGIVFARCWPLLWCHLGAWWLSCPNKWLCTWQGFNSKHTLQTLHNKDVYNNKANITKQGQHHRATLVFLWWVAELTCPLTLHFAHCHQDVDLGLNCFAPTVALWNGIGGYHYAQMSLCNNQWGEESWRWSIN